MDVYNGEIIGFSMTKRPTLNFVLESLNQAPYHCGTRRIQNNNSFRSRLALSTQKMGEIIKREEDFSKYVLQSNVCRLCGNGKLLRLIATTNVLWGRISII